MSKATPSSRPASRSRCRRPATSASKSSKASASEMTQPQGEQVADLISFNRDDPREMLSMHSSRAVNLSWKLTKPHDALLQPLPRDVEDR